MNSILQTEKRCIECGATYNLNLHHCLYGSANRKLSDKYGLTVWLCIKHHTGQEGVHHGNKELDLKLKRYAQKTAEQYYGWTTDEFIKIFGKNYKED